MTSPFSSKAAASRRQRGITLVEATLYLTIAASMTIFIANTVADEQRRQGDIQAASHLRMTLEASQRFVAGRYDTLREQLFTEATTSGNAIMAVPIQRLVDDGYMAANFLNNEAGNGIVNSWGQEFVILMRAVDRADTAAPAATLTLAQLDPVGANALDPAWTDGTAANGEMDIEAILATSGGNTAPGTRAGPVIVRTAMATAGMVRDDGLAAGPYGNWELDLTPFEDLAQVPGPGRFASIVALSKFGVMDAEQAVETDEYLSRCADIITDLGLTVGSVEYQTCLDAENDMFSSIVFNYDLNADGVEDYWPGIETRKIACENLDPADSIAAGRLVLDCAETVATGNLVVEGTLLQLGEVAITDTSSDPSDPALTITADTTIDGDLDVEGRAEADRFVSETLNGGQDLNAGIYDARIAATGELIDKPVCPAFIETSAGNVTAVPRIYVTPAALGDANGSALVGTRAYTEDLGTQWRVRLVQFVNRDEYTLPASGVAAILGVTPPAGGANQPLGSAGPDSASDAYEVGSDFGRVMVMTRCY